MSRSDTRSAIEIANENRIRQLPEPFDDVYFEWDASDDGIELVYAGTASRLIACGAIEPHMADRSEAKSRARVDSAGHYFRTYRSIDKETVSVKFTITRRITDMGFAETLPGAPRGLRFKRLDWLDANPDRVHIATGDSFTDEYVRIITAGTAENLMAAGFHEKLFKQKFPLAKSWKNSWNEGGRDSKVRRLMRGYFDVEVNADREAQPHLRGPIIQAHADTNGIPSPRPAFLRLVIDNTREVDHA
jgi:hypothetical protein